MVGFDPGWMLSCVLQQPSGAQQDLMHVTQNTQSRDTSLPVLSFPIPPPVPESAGGDSLADWVL